MLVDTHIHYLPDTIRAAYRRHAEPPMIVPSEHGESLAYGAGHLEPIGPAEGQWDRLLQALESVGTDVALVSINQPGVLGLPVADGVALARDANDELIALADASGGRVVGMATLPWLEPDEAAAELERTAGLGMRGAMVPSNLCGEAVDAPRFAPVLEAAAALHAPLLLHPTLPLSAPHVHEYKGLLSAVGYLFDTTTAATRLLLSGVSLRLPELGVVLAHSASLLPALAGRLDEEWRRGGLALPEGVAGPPSELLRWLYSDTAGGSVTAVAACIALLGTDRVMFGSDYPFWTAEAGAEIFAGLALSEAEREKVASTTAVSLFGLPHAGVAGSQ